MATITKRTNKDGSFSYLIRAFVDQGPDGKQIRKTMTWKPPPGMRLTAADKEAEKEATRFEDRARRFASINGKTKFNDFAQEWVETSDLAPKTREQYEYLLNRINKAFGHIAIEKLESSHVKRFIKNLRESGIKTVGNYAFSASLVTGTCVALLRRKQ